MSKGLSSRKRRGGNTSSRQAVEAYVPDAIDLHAAAVKEQAAQRVAERRAAMTHEDLIDEAAQFKGDMTVEERYGLLERVARNEPMRFIEIPSDSPMRRPTFNYRMLYPHPLPVDSVAESRLENDVAMREINHLRADARAWRAVTRNRPWCLEELYLTGFDINTPNDDGLTPFHLACHFGYLACVHVFLNAGADIDAENTAGVTPLQSALASGHAHIAALLREANATKWRKIALSGHRTILDVAVDRVGRCVVDEVADAHKRPAYFLQY